MSAEDVDGQATVLSALAGRLPDQLSREELRALAGSPGPLSLLAAADAVADAAQERLEDARRAEHDFDADDLRTSAERLKRVAQWLRDIA